MEQNIPIFIINLAKDTDKKAHMQQLCEKHSLDCQFIEAVYGKDLSEEYIQTVYDKNKSIEKIGREMGFGEIGCALSHITIYKKIIVENHPYAIVLEDDIDILYNLQTVIDNYKNFPSDLELLLLGEYRNHISADPQFSSFWREHSIGSGFKTVRLIKRSFGTHGYMITKHGAKKLLGQLDKIAQPIDLYTGSEKFINVYAIRPIIIMPHNHYAAQSNLTDDRSGMMVEKNQVQQKDKLLIQILKKIGIEEPLRILYYRLKIPTKYTTK